jgi:hypothetical protein
MDKRVKHGLRKGYQRTVEYVAWVNMRQRCARTRGPDFPNYRGRGISVCREWEAFEQFLLDMGPRPSAQHTLERTDNDLGYSKSNCTWATRAAQNANQRLRIDNTTGVRGVQAHPDGFVASASLRGQRVHLYFGKDLFEAFCARKSWDSNGKGA